MQPNKSNSGEVVFGSGYASFKSIFKGEIHLSSAMRSLYATDASSYRELPAAVTFPKDSADVIALIKSAKANKFGIIPRTAGTSLAGQVVGSGVIADVSRTFTKILEVNEEESWVRVQPGVVRDELNRHLESFGLYFGPETSTANRAMLGGMVGNNSCGSNSIVYGSTREHCQEINAILSDGSEVCFKNISQSEFEQKLKLDSLEGQLYRHINSTLRLSVNKEAIEAEFPKPSIPRRNTGYALDMLLHSEVFGGKESGFNFSKLICGSEGTLAFITEIKLGLSPLPPEHKILLCGHFESVDEALHANLIALKYNPSAVELMDHHVLECTKNSISQSKNRFFLKGDPNAVLVIELSRDSEQDLLLDTDKLEAAFKQAAYGYHFARVHKEDIKRVWNLRKAGLGLLSNIPGDAKPVPVIEDTAVDVEDLPAYIAEFNALLKKHDRYCVHYAHAGSGELHLRPILNLKTAEGQRLFRVIAEEVSGLVKKYRGSLSGEHGDGRLRGEFLVTQIGQHNYDLLVDLKKNWDPNGIFNPGKITDTPAMDKSLRFEPGQETKSFSTAFNFRKEQGILRSTEQCNGSGDCRKSHLAGGTMCPSYQVTRNEKDTTRARANILREVMTRSSLENPFADPDIAEVMELCLSCKGCTGECPSNVDMTRLKSEWQHQLHKTNGVSLRTKLFGHANKLNEIGSKVSFLANFALRGPLSFIGKSILGVASERTLPKIASQSFTSWFENSEFPVKENPTGELLFFVDAFTNYLDVEIGKAAVKLLLGLGYTVSLAPAKESGRTYLSKGMLDEAKALAEYNVAKLSGIVNEKLPLVGIEPSAVLSFKDEYPDLVSDQFETQAKSIATHTFLIDDFLANEFEAGRITSDAFDEKEREIYLHGHCHQKALVGPQGSAKALGIPLKNTVTLIPSGCCGMAGSFGYEKEHYSVSMQVGELVLFPAVRNTNHNAIIAAPGTSCRHQIADGTGRSALHPVEILLDALKKQAFF
ncbi:MAG: FAD/FMN-containing dehydrogenase/Fe-S oxidoreductase [Limisphaerales bacterium]|jgi:FAD/FMN-containing dehydrogenase/Fe-S oxidoreductase